MTNSTRQSDQWETCQPGDLVQAVDELRSHGRKLNKLTLGVSVTTLVAVAIAFGLLFGDSAPQPTDVKLPVGVQIGDLWCSDMHQLIPQYVARKLDTKLASQVKTHLESCQACERYHRELVDQANKTAHQRSTRHSPVLLASSR